MLASNSHTRLIHLGQGKAAESAGKDGGKKKSKAAGDAGCRAEVGPLFLLIFSDFFFPQVFNYDPSFLVQKDNS